MLSLSVFFLFVIHYYFNSFSFWIASFLAMTQSGATAKAKQKSVSQPFSFRWMALVNRIKK